MIGTIKLWLMTYNFWKLPYHSYIMAEKKSYNQTCSKADIHACCCREVIQSNLQQSRHACLLLLRSHTSKPASKLTYMLAVAAKSFKQTCSKADMHAYCCWEVVQATCSKNDMHACCCWEVLQANPSKADMHACCCWEAIQANLHQSWLTCLLLLRSHSSKPAAKLICMLAVAEKSYKQTCKADMHACCC